MLNPSKPSTPQDLLFSAKEPDLSELKATIKQLEGKVRFRDEKIAEMVKGYAQDVLNVKEQKLFGKRKGFADEAVEVKYFSEAAALDGAAAQIVQQAVRDTRYKYEKRIEDMQREFTRLEQKNKRMQDRIDELMDTSGGVKEAIERLIKLTGYDLYMLWKGLQDCIGNPKLFSVFDVVKQGYGINYDEIFKLLVQNKAAQCNFELIRQKLNENLQSMALSLTASEKSYEEQRDDFQRQLKLQQLSQNYELEVQIEMISAKFKHEYQSQLEKSIKLHESKLEQVMKDSAQNVREGSLVTRVRARGLLMQWYFCTRLQILQKKVNYLMQKQDKEGREQSLSENLQKTKQTLDNTIKRTAQFDIDVGGDQCTDAHSATAVGQPVALLEGLLKQIKDLQDQIFMQQQQQKCSDNLVSQLLLQNSILKEKIESINQQYFMQEQMVKRFCDTLDVTDVEMGIKKLSTQNIDSQIAQYLILDVNAHQTTKTDLKLKMAKNTKDRAINTFLMDVKVPLAELEQTTKFEDIRAMISVGEVVLLNTNKKYVQKKSVAVQTDGVKILKRQEIRKTNNELHETHYKDKIFEKLFLEAELKELKSRVREKESKLEENFRWQKNIETINVQHDEENLSNDVACMLQRHHYLMNRQKQYYSLFKRAKSVPPKQQKNYVKPNEREEIVVAQNTLQSNVKMLAVRDFQDFADNYVQRDRSATPNAMFEKQLTEQLLTAKSGSIGGRTLNNSTTVHAVPANFKTPLASRYNRQLRALTQSKFNYQNYQ